MNDWKCVSRVGGLQFYVGVSRLQHKKGDSTLAARMYVLSVSVQIMMNEGQWDRRTNKNVIFNMLSLTLGARRKI